MFLLIQINQTCRNVINLKKKIYIYIRNEICISVMNRSKTLHNHRNIIYYSTYFNKYFIAQNTDSYSLGRMATL